MDFHIIHGQAGEVFNTGFQVIRHASSVFLFLFLLISRLIHCQLSLNLVAGTARLVI